MISDGLNACTACFDSDLATYLPPLLIKQDASSLCDATSFAFDEHMPSSHLIWAVPPFLTKLHMMGPKRKKIKNSRALPGFVISHAIFPHCHGDETVKGSFIGTNACHGDMSASGP